MERLFILAGIFTAYYGQLSLFFLFLIIAGLFRSHFALVYFLLAIGYALWHQHHVMPDLSLNPARSHLVEAVGQVASIPKQSRFKTSFQFQVDKLNAHENKPLLLVSWYNSKETVHYGQKLRLLLRIKRARNLYNPASFNYERWLQGRHIQWTGYVKRLISKEQGENKSSLMGLREELATEIEKTIPNAQVAAIVQALALGMGERVDDRVWELFRKTGTSHLLVISGTHIALVAGLGFGICSWFWLQLPGLRLKISSLKIGLVGGFWLAFLYAAISGFAPPAQRALIAYVFFMLQGLGKRYYSSWQICAYALMAVVLYEPHAVLYPGVYLSFVAVASIILVTQRWPRKGIFKFLYIQLACLIGLLPFCLYWFQYAAVNGLLANILAIPLLGFCIIPMILVFLIAMNTMLLSLVLPVLTGSILLFLYFLQQIASFSMLNLSVSSLSVYGLLALLSALVLLCCFPYRVYGWPALMLVSSAFFPPIEKITHGEALIHVLDVGQGLSVFIRTKYHTLIYDTGDKFFEGSDMGKLVLLPLLKQKGIHAIDRLVISHPDKDHSGGLKSLEQEMQIKELIVNDRTYYQRGLNCHHLPAWQWDGVDFRFFPIHKEFKAQNNHSCVLQISTPYQKMLLSGDIEAAAEAYLVDTYANDLASEVLLVPHHGSKTSSSLIFLNKVSPKIAIASQGFNNRFHFPHAQTIERYKALGVQFVTTEQCGMVSFHMGRDLSPMLCYKTPEIDLSLGLLHSISGILFEG